MIAFLTNWIENVAVSVIIVNIFELLLPKGNIKKYIKVILGIYVVFSLISPFVNAKNLYSFSEKNIDTYLKNNINSNDTQSYMDKRLQELYIDEMEQNIKSKIKQYGYKTIKCVVDANLDTSSKNAGIYKIELVIEKNIGAIENVDINIGKKDAKEEKSKDELAIVEDLSSYYEIDSEKISIKIN